MIDRGDIVSFLDETLQPQLFKDSTFNGLQIEGKNTIKRIGFTVDSGLEVFEKAANAGCDMLIVHHGLIWNGWKKISQANKKRLEILFNNDLNLYVSHLPLDAHPFLGNNAQLLSKLGCFFDSNFKEIGKIGKFKEAVSLDSLLERVRVAVNPEAVSYPGREKLIERMLIYSGAMSLSALEEAADGNVQLVLSGEPMGKSMFHFPILELGIGVIFAGHYQTETFGVKALMKLIGERYRTDVETVWIDCPHD